MEEIFYFMEMSGRGFILKYVMEVILGVYKERGVSVFVFQILVEIFLLGFRAFGGRGGYGVFRVGGFFWCVFQTVYALQNFRLVNGRQSVRDLGTRIGRFLGWFRERGVIYKFYYEFFLFGIRQEVRRGREQVSGGELLY